MSRSAPDTEGGPAPGPGAGRPRVGRFLSGLTWPRLAWYQEILAVILGDVLYEVIRASAPQHAAQAFHNATLLTAIEPGPVRAGEVWMRDLTTAHSALGVTFGWYYALLHLTMTGGVLLWLWWRRPTEYARARTALFALTFGALMVFWVFPVAPPRLVTPEAISALGTPAMAALDGAGGAGSTGGAVGLLVNPYAAFPSLHVAWAAWCAWAIWAHLRDRPRWLAWLYPAATVIVVVGTSNHYVVDVVAGLLLVLLAVVA